MIVRVQRPAGVNRLWRIDEAGGGPYQRAVSQVTLPPRIVRQMEGMDEAWWSATLRGGKLVLHELAPSPDPREPDQAA